MLRKTDASLVKKFLITSDAPDLETKALIQKLDEVAKTVDLDVSTILEEQMKGPVLGTVRSWIRKNTSPDTKSPETQQSKGLLRYCQEFNRFLIEEEDSSFATMNRQTSLKRRISVFASLYLYSLHASVWDTTTKWVDTWEQLKLMPMPKDFITGLESLLDMCFDSRLPYLPEQQT